MVAFSANENNTATFYKIMDKFENQQLVYK